MTIDDLPVLPRDKEGPVFKEPWEAQAFALAMYLLKVGYFTWPEWAESLNQEIRAAQERGDPTWVIPTTSIGSTSWSGYALKRNWSAART